MWRNWSGGQRCAPVRVACPRDAGEVADAVVRAGRDGHAVRTAGAGHSFSDLVVTPGVLLRLERMRAVLEVDAGAGLVRAQAGITLGELGDALAERGLALRNLGDIDRQTLAGAIATATHGTGIGFPTLSEDVAAIELVTADGTPRRCSPERDAELFRAAQVSLGALGVVTAITVRCVPAFRLRVVEETRPLTDVLDALDDLAAAHDHFEVFSFPYADSALVRTADRTDEPPTPRGPLRAWAQDILVGNHVFEAALIAGAGVPAAIPPLNRLATRAGGGIERVADGRRALANERRMRFEETEWALPRERAAEAVREVHALVRERRLRLNLPLELRFGAPDQGFLSPAHGRESCFVAVHAYHRLPWQPAFLAVEAALAPLGGRPHWGKRHLLTAEALAPRYPAWDRFAAVRDEVDPEGRFANAGLDRVLGLPAESRRRAYASASRTAAAIDGT